MTFEKERIDFWIGAIEGSREKGHWPPVFSGADHAIKSVFEGRSVLEIGPGMGRQFGEASALSESWSFADISQEILDAMPGNYTKHLLTSYADDFEIRYDVVTFWYVIHHVTNDELEAFGEFVLRHVRPGGMIFFNAAAPIKHPPKSLGGMGTTHHSVAAMESHLGLLNEVAKESGHAAYVVRT